MTQHRTFIKGAHRIGKTYDKDGADSFFFPKRVTSTEAEVTTWAELLTLYTSRADEGMGLMRGPLTKALVSESRAGLTDNSALSNWITLDFDGLNVAGYANGPQTTDQVRSIAAIILRNLPRVFQDATHLVHPSSSYGIKRTASMHFEFWLESPVSHKVVSNLIKHLSLSIPFFSEQNTLNATGTVLKYAIDPVMAQNSRVITLAPPAFEDATAADPLKPADRFFLVMGGHNVIPAEYMESVPGIATLARQEKTLINALREAEGLPSKRPSRAQVEDVDGKTVYVLNNPDKVKLHKLRDYDEYTTYNVERNGVLGDSGAYFVRHESPTIVRNFKGEDAFFFQKADEDAFKGYLKERPITGAELAPTLPFVFRDKITDRYMLGLQNAATEAIEELNPARLQGIPAFFAQYSASAPDAVDIPACVYRFAPHDERRVDLQGAFINQYTPPALLNRMVDLPPRYTGLDFVSMVDSNKPRTLERICPTAHRILYSMVGSNEECYFRFLNWFAFILQFKAKTKTAWLFSGVEGTGKGAFFAKVLSPLLGPRYTTMKTLDNVEDKFDGWRSEHFLVAVDEFNITSSSAADRLAAKLRTMITEDRTTLRFMNTNQVTAELYENYIFFSNKHGFMSIPDSDRRFNVCPRQEVKLELRHPEIRRDIDTKLPDELPVLLSILMQANVNIEAAQTAMETEEKEDMRAVSKTTKQDFVSAFQTGNADYLLTVLEEGGREATVIDAGDISAENVVKAMLRDGIPGTRHVFTAPETRALYLYLVGRTENTSKFKKTLMHDGLRQKVYNDSGKSVRGYAFEIMPDEVRWIALQRQFLTPADYTLARQKVPAHIMARKNA